MTATTTGIWPRTVLGPLSTVFTRPSDCTIFFQAAAQSGWRDAWQAQTCETIDLHDNPSCWPTATVTPTDRTLSGWGFYSPGLSCPNGYTTACVAGMTSEQDSNTPSFQFQFSTLVDEAVYGCCPVGYTCARNMDSQRQTCMKAVDSSTFRIATCSNGDAVSTTDWTLPLANSITSGPAPTVTLFAPLIQLNRKTSDITAQVDPASLYSTHTVSELTTGLSTSTTSEKTSSFTGLSDGTKVGIGVGVAVGIFAVASAAFFLFFLFRRRRLGRISTSASEESRAEMDGISYQLKMSQQVYELPTRDARAELPAGL